MGVSRATKYLRRFGPKLGGLLVLLLPLFLLDVLCPAAYARKARFKMNMLPEGPGTESRGATNWEWDEGAWITQIVVGGEVIVDTKQMPTLWLSPNGVWGAPIFLPSGGSGGWIKALGGGSMGEAYMAAGAVKDGSDMVNPAYWEASSSAGPYTLTPLPLLVAGGEGEVTCPRVVGVTVDTEIVALCGWATDAVSVTKPVVWSKDMTDMWSVVELPDLFPGADGAALDIRERANGELKAVGWAYDDQGKRRAVVWEKMMAGTWQVPMTLANLPGGTESEARALTYDAMNRLVIVGWSEVAGGARHAVLWRYDGVVWETVDFGAPMGWENAAANISMVGASEVVGTADVGSGIHKPAIFSKDGPIWTPDLLENRIMGDPADFYGTASCIHVSQDGLLRITGDRTIQSIAESSLIETQHAFVLTEVRPMAERPHELQYHFPQ